MNTKMGFDLPAACTREGKTPTLADLAPLYQAIAHGCRAGRHQEALDRVYIDRICRRRPDGQLEYYSMNELGAAGIGLAAISWFFVTPYETPVATLRDADRAWVLAEASILLRAQGRIAEAQPALRAAVRMEVDRQSWQNAAIGASSLSDGERLVGAVSTAVFDAEQCVNYADRSNHEFWMILSQTTLADAMYAAGQRDKAERLFADAERRQQKWQPEYPLLYSMPGYRYCDFLLTNAELAAVGDRATRALEVAKRNNRLLDIALHTLTLARASLRSALTTADSQPPAPIALSDARALGTAFDRAAECLRAAATNEFLARGLLARAAFRRSVGDWSAAARDLDEVEEIAEPGPMRLYLCDGALERARLAFARLEAFAPLNGLVDETSPKRVPPDAADPALLREQATENLATARKLIADCGYHRRDEELAELEDVAAGRRRFADLPPRV
jgi:hypothetical protein